MMLPVHDSACVEMVDKNFLGHAVKEFKRLAMTIGLFESLHLRGEAQEETRDHALIATNP